MLNLLLIKQRDLLLKYEILINLFAKSLFISKQPPSVRYATSSADSIKVCDFSVSLSDTIEHIRVFLNVKDSLAFLLSPAANTAFSPSSI